MTDSSSASKTWGAFTPAMPAFIRLIVSVIVLVAVEAVVLGFPGINQPISGSSISIANVAVFLIGLFVFLILLKFGDQLTTALTDAYKSYKSWTPLVGYCFQLIAVIILYAVTNGLVNSYFVSAPWVVPLVFLLMALIPTIKVAISFVHNLEGTSSSKHSQNQS
jgi:hypothetical protein